VATSVFVFRRFEGDFWGDVEGDFVKSMTSR
jgi:hypothetical protein